MDKTKDQQKKLFQELLMPELGALFRTALRMTRNREDAEDLVQETIANEVAVMDRFENGVKYRGLIIKNHTNTLINNDFPVLGSEILPSVGGLGEKSAFLPVFEGISPEQALLNTLTREDIQRAIDVIPIDFKSVVILNLVEGFSYKETAEILDIPIGTVMSRLHRGRKILQKLLWEYSSSKNSSEKGTKEEWTAKKQ